MEERTYIVAEAGVNHNGRLDLAMKLIDAAAEAGVDAVKFQTFRADQLATDAAAKAQYQMEHTSADESQLDMLRKLELTAEDFEKIWLQCRRRGIDFLSSPFDLESVRLLDKLGMRIFKIPSGEITNLPFLRAIGKLHRRVFLSTGMSTLGEIEAALDALITAGTPKEEITVLHCNTEFPSPMTDVNLRAMKTIRRAFKVGVGYSDHTPGIEIPIAAVTMGATVIEKHFTLDRAMPGPDHATSLDRDGLKAMVQAIRRVELALGDGCKQPTQSESKNLTSARKSIVAARDIKTGEIFSEANLAVKRPGDGVSPMRWDEVIGRKAARAYGKDEPIRL